MAARLIQHLKMHFMLLLVRLAIVFTSTAYARHLYAHANLGALRLAPRGEQLPTRTQRKRAKRKRRRGENALQDARQEPTRIAKVEEPFSEGELFGKTDDTDVREEHSGDWKLIQSPKKRRALTGFEEGYGETPSTLGIKIIQASELPREPAITAARNVTPKLPLPTAVLSKQYLPPISTSAPLCTTKPTAVVEDELPKRDTPFPFLDLPRELRDMIYDLVIEDTINRVEFSSSSFSGSSSSETCTSLPQESWASL